MTNLESFKVNMSGIVKLTEQFNILSNATSKCIDQIKNFSKYMEIIKDKRKSLYL